MCVFLSLFWSGHFCELGAGTFVSAIVNDFGPENDFPYWKPFLLAGTKREPIKQSLWEQKSLSCLKEAPIHSHITNHHLQFITPPR